jgi:hypothetical protein
MVGGDVSQNALERANFDGTVIWNHLVVLSSRLGSHPEMGAALPGYDLSKHSQRYCQLRAAEIPRRFHRASTSSRTK